MNNISYKMYKKLQTVDSLKKFRLIKWKCVYILKQQVGTE